jgi:hypothetical protein
MQFIQLLVNMDVVLEYIGILQKMHFEVFNGNKHYCPNRQKYFNNYNKKTTSPPTLQSSTNKTNYYSTTNKNKNKKHIIPTINLNQKCLILLSY